MPLPYLKRHRRHTTLANILCRSRLSERRSRGNPSSEHLLPFDVNDVIGAYPTHAYAFYSLITDRGSVIPLACFIADVRDTRIQDDTHNSLFRHTRLTRIFGEMKKRYDTVHVERITRKHIHIYIRVNQARTKIKLCQIGTYMYVYTYITMHLYYLKYICTLKISSKDLEGRQRTRRYTETNGWKGAKSIQGQKESGDPTEQVSMNSPIQE